MAAISTAEKFLGSLLGGYLGYHYLDNVDDRLPEVEHSQLYQAWSAGAPWLKPSDQCLGHITQPTEILPWLLYYHSDRTHRHQWLARLSISAADSDLLGSCYVLGDSLEWIMQCLETRNLRLLLHQHLQQRSYSQSEQAAVTSVFTALSHLPLDQPTTLPSCMACAIARLDYPENLALAFGSLPRATLTMLGALSGARAGTSVIPIPWMCWLSSDSRQALDQLAGRLYRHWAGVLSAAGDLTISSLD